MDHRAEIRDFLATRRAKLTPEDVGLPTTARRRVPGLRREEVAVIAGVSTDWYTRLEKGHIAGVSAEVLNAVADALRLSEDERTYLADLAQAARPSSRRTVRRREVALAPPVAWLLDSITMSAALVRNGRLDVVESNPLARALHAPMFESTTTVEHGRPNFGRFYFLDDTSRDFFLEWEAGAAATVALLRAEAGREPNDKALRELVGELSTLSPDFRSLWASHDIRTRHDGIKRVLHPAVGEVELQYQSVELPTSGRAWHDLSFYTAEPASASEERLKVLASWAAPSPSTSASQPSDATSSAMQDS